MRRLFLTLSLCFLTLAILWTGYNLNRQARAEQDAQRVLQSVKQVTDRTMEQAAGESTAAASESIVSNAGAGGNPSPDSTGSDTEEILEDTLPDYEQDPAMPMPVITVDGEDYIGCIAIPVLDIELPVFSSWSYPHLKVAPCRYYGSAYSDNLVLVAHNYSYHFGRLATLSPGDALSFTDMQGNVFCYEVLEIEILEPTAVDEMVSGTWDLTLFTCTLGGKARVTVRCAKTADIPAADRQTAEASALSEG